MPSWSAPGRWTMPSRCKLPTCPIRCERSVHLPTRKDCDNYWSWLCERRQMPQRSDCRRGTVHLPSWLGDHPIRTRMPSQAAEMPYQPTIGCKWKLRMPTRTSEDPMGARMLFSRPNLPLRTNPLRRRLHMPTRSREDRQRYGLPSPDRRMSSTPVPGSNKRPMHLPTWTVCRQLRHWLCCSRDL